MTVSTYRAATSPTGVSKTIPGAVRSKLAFTPVATNDVEASTQWHFSMLGDVMKLWSDFTGKGVSVGIYDSGVQYEHWDLAPNYDASKHVVVDGYEYDGDFHPASGPHGTSVAGIIGAVRNGRGVVGIAYETTLTGVNIFNPYSEDGSGPGIFVNAGDKTKFFEAMWQTSKFDVVNHSWGGAEAYYNLASRDVAGTDSFKMVRAITNASNVGRDGLGTIQVNASGNTIVPGRGSLDDQTDSWKSDRHVITVGAYRGDDGSSTFYSTHGAHLLISAPSGEAGPFDSWKGIATTDLLGTAGYNFAAAPGAKSDVTDDFNGTSAATPIVSGVVALMLDANENLGWRDVSNIIAASAKMPVAFETGQTYDTAKYDAPRIEVVKGKDYVLNSSSFKLGGGDANWNGGRMHYSTDYGYGAIDAYAAVRMAEVWGLFAAAKTSVNEQSVDTGMLPFAIKPPNNGAVDATKAYNDFVGTPVEVSIAVDGNVAAEHIDLTVAFSARALDNAATLSGVRFKVIAPDGTSAFVDTVEHVTYFTRGDEQQFTFGLAAFRGVEIEGTWRVQFESFPARFDPDLTITGLQLKAFGGVANDDDVYTYTNEFFAMAAIRGEAGRKMLLDVDAGTDWINAAAVSSDVKLSLAGGATSFGAQKAFLVAKESMIENAVTGDGNDTLTGNRLDNKLFGMRGNDVLNGGLGNDTLFGGTGMDKFLFDNRGASGKDIVVDWSRGDMIATQTELRGKGSDGTVTVAKNAMLLLDGQLTGDTVTLSQNGGAVLQAQGKKDGYHWYAFLSGTDLNPNDVIREASFQPETTAAGLAGAVVATADVAGADSTFAAPAGGGGQDAFYLYDAMAGSMSAGVLLTA